MFSFYMNTVGLFRLLGPALNGPLLQRHLALMDTCYLGMLSSLTTLIEGFNPVT